MFVICNLEKKKVITDLTIPLAKHNLPGLRSYLASNTVNSLERKISAKASLRARKGSTLFILNGDMSDIIKMIKWIEHSGVLMNGVTGIVKNEIENKKQDFLEFLLAPLAASVAQLVIFSVAKGIIGRGIIRTGSGI